MEFQEAGFVNFLRTIFWIVIIYYAFKLIVRLLAPIVVKKAVSKMQQKANKQYASGQDNTVKTGETVIDKTPSSTTKNSKTVGEYIDFEEID